VAEIKAPLFAADGTEKGLVDLDPAVFGVEPNIPLMHQVVTAQLAGARAGTHSTKSRAEVSGGGRKPWRQKGLGRARQGSIRAPHWKGGGVAHGPKPRDYSQRTPRKMKRLALWSALSARAAEGAIRVVEPIDWTKTRQAVALLDRMGVAGKALVVLGGADAAAERAFRNLPHVVIAEPGHLTTYDVLWAGHVVFTTATVGALNRAGAYDVSESDFVREDASVAGGEG
jgi:large subunit ribosomal protein L4